MLGLLQECRGLLKSCTTLQIHLCLSREGIHTHQAMEKHITPMWMLMQKIAHHSREYKSQDTKPQRGRHLFSDADSSKDVSVNVSIVHQCGIRRREPVQGFRVDGDPLCFRKGFRKPRASEIRYRAMVFGHNNHRYVRIRSCCLSRLH